MTDIEVKITNSTPAAQSNYSSNISRSPVNLPSVASGLQLNHNIPSPSSPLSSLSSASSTSSPPTASANTNTGLRIIKEASLVGEISQVTASKAQNIGSITVSKKSRKSKTPVACRSQQRKVSSLKSSISNKDISNISSGGSNFNISNTHLRDRGMDMIAERTSNSNTLPTGAPNMSSTADINGLPLPPPNTGIKSYSDFMRNLAAKYNNNDYNSPPRNALDSPFPPFKTGTTPMTQNNAPPTNTSTAQSNPLLGNFQSPFPFSLGNSGLGNFGLTAANLAAAAAAAAGNKQLLDDKPSDVSKPSLSSMGNIAGIPGLSMQSMMDLTSTHQALLSLARSAAASNFPGSISSSNTPNTSSITPNLSSSEPETSLKSSVGESKKRSSSGTPRTNAECPLDLSGPQTVPTKRPRLSTDAENIANDRKYLFRSEPDKQGGSASILTNGGPSSLLTMQLNAKPSTQIQVDPTILNWKVEDVMDFVSSIDICKEYSEIFREHNIDGSSLPLLTEDHLTMRLGMKLGPALKLKSIIAKKLGPAHAEICVHCAHCHASSKVANNSHGTQRNLPMSYVDQHNPLIQKSELNIGGQNSFSTSIQTSTLPSLVSEDRRSPSESSNVSTGNIQGCEIKEEPNGRTGSRNSNTAENKNDSLL